MHITIVYKDEIETVKNYKDHIETKGPKIVDKPKLNSIRRTNLGPSKDASFVKRSKFFPQINKCQ